MILEVRCKLNRVVKVLFALPFCIVCDELLEIIIEYFPQLLFNSITTQGTLLHNPFRMVFIDHLLFHILPGLSFVSVHNFSSLVPIITCSSKTRKE